MNYKEAALNSFLLSLVCVLCSESPIKKQIPTWDKKTIERVGYYSPMIKEISTDLGIDPNISLSISWIESHFRPNAISSAGAKGLMQVKDSTKNYMLDKYSNYSIAYTKQLFKGYKDKDIINVISGVLYLKYLIEKFESEKKAIVAYNEGPTGMIRLYKKGFDLENHSYYKKFNKRNSSLKSSELIPSRRYFYAIQD